MCQQPSEETQLRFAEKNEAALLARRAIAYATAAGFARGVLKALRCYNLPKEAEAVVAAAVVDMNDQLEAIDAIQ